MSTCSVAGDEAKQRDLGRDRQGLQVLAVIESVPTALR